MEMLRKMNQTWWEVEDHFRHLLFFLTNANFGFAGRNCLQQFYLQEVFVSAKILHDIR